MKIIVRSFSIYRLIGTIGVFSVILFPILKANVFLFINIPSAILTYGITFFLLLNNFGKDFIEYLPNSILCFFAVPVEKKTVFAEISKYGSRYVIASGLIGTLIGLVQMLQSMDDPSIIGPSIAIALLPTFYAILAAEIFFAYSFITFNGAIFQNRDSSNV